MQPTNTTLVNSSISQTASQSDRAQPMNLLQPINENECVEKFNQAIDANKMNNMRELFDEILKYGEEGSMLVCNVIIAHTNEVMFNLYANEYYSKIWRVCRKVKMHFIKYVAIASHCLCCGCCVNITLNVMNRLI